MVPLKWRKYQLLERYCLCPEKVLAADIHRFPWSERHDLHAAISKTLKASNGKCLVVVKLVPLNELGFLPNYRITHNRDLDGLGLFLSNPAVHVPHEVWYCTTRIDPSTFSVAGRLSLSSDGCRRQVLEQVWRCSPRLIEQVAIGGLQPFEFPYARLHRTGWGRPYVRSALHRPRTWRESVRQLTEGLGVSVSLLETIRDRIELFEDGVHAAGITTVSLEYKVVGTRIWCIDWDTADDMRVLRCLKA